MKTTAPPLSPFDGDLLDALRYVLGQGAAALPPLEATVHGNVIRFHAPEGGLRELVLLTPLPYVARPEESIRERSGLRPPHPAPSPPRPRTHCGFCQASFVLVPPDPASPSLCRDCAGEHAPRKAVGR